MFISFVCLLLFFSSKVYEKRLIDEVDKYYNFTRILYFCNQSFINFFAFRADTSYADPCNVLNSLFMSLDWPTNYTDTPYRTLNYPSIPFIYFVVAAIVYHCIEHFDFEMRMLIHIRPIVFLIIFVKNV